MTNNTQSEQNSGKAATDIIYECLGGVTNPAAAIMVADICWKLAGGDWVFAKESELRKLEAACPQTPPANAVKKEFVTATESDIDRETFEDYFVGVADEMDRKSAEWGFICGTMHGNVSPASAVMREDACRKAFEADNLAIGNYYALPEGPSFDEGDWLIWKQSWKRALTEATAKQEG